MASLTGNQIDNTYQGLIKTDDNGEVGSTEKQLTDGVGNTIPVSMGTSGVSFIGDVDFTNATVTGLPDNDTTYAISATGGISGTSGINLTGSDASTSGVNLIEGTNIALTQNGNDITIDATGGASSVGPLYNSVSRYLADEYIIASGSNQGEIGHQMYATSSSTVYPNLQWSRTTTTLTITHNNHGLSQGDTVIIRNANEDNIAVKVDTVPNSNEFTVEVADSGGTSGNNAAYSVGITVSVDKFSEPAVTGVITVSAPANSDVQLLGLTFGDTTEQEIEYFDEPPFIIYIYTKKNEYYLEVPANILAGTGVNNSPLNTTIPIWSLHSTALSTGYEVPRCTEQDSSNCVPDTAWLRMFGSSNNYNEYEFGYNAIDSNRIWRFDFS